MADKKVGEITKEINNVLGTNMPLGDIMLADGLSIHLVKRDHSSMIKLLPYLDDIIKTADYIGENTRHLNSFELVKVMDDNVQVAIKLSLEDGYYFVATVHELTDSKLNSRIKSGRLKPYKKGY